MQIPEVSDAVLTLPPRVGIESEQPIRSTGRSGRVLANNRTLAVSRTDVERAQLSAEGATGALDNVVSWSSFYQHQVTPVSSFLGGSTTGSLTSNTFDTVPQLNGYVLEAAARRTRHSCRRSA